MKGRHITYSEAELIWIEWEKERPRAAAHAQFCNIFGRDDVSLSNYNSLCKRMGWMTGRTGAFEKGAVPMNKGKQMPFNAASAATRFKPGNQPHNTHYLGHERLSKDGYVEISVAEVNPHTGYERRYVQKHRLLWEKQHGPVPVGMRLKCLDANRKNTDPENWEAVPMALAPRLNGRFGRGFDAAPAYLKPVIMAACKLEHAARERRKETRK